MTKKMQRNIIAGLDIGTSKIVTLIGEVQDDNQIELIGIGVQPSSGLKKGVVVNIEATIASIQRATEEAELMAGVDLHSVYTGIAGGHIRSINSHGIVAIRDKEVSSGDVDRVIDAAKAVAIPADQQILHILPQEFMIDSQAGIREPIGMSGVRLEAKVHMVTAAVSAQQNIVKCVRRCGLEVSDIILQQLASAQSVLTDDEKELGVCLVDIGGGTTDIAVFQGGAICHSATMPIAGDQVTNDIAVALRMPTQIAEELKVLYGTVSSRVSEGNDVIDEPGLTDNLGSSVTRRALADVMAPRYEELLSLVASELTRAGLDEHLAAGIVLTGGSSRVAGGVELAERQFQQRVRLGLPQKVRGLEDIVQSPIYSTATGLLLYGHKQQELGFTQPLVRPGVKNIFSRVQSWFQGQL